MNCEPQLWVSNNSAELQSALAVASKARVAFDISEPAAAAGNRPTTRTHSQKQSSDVVNLSTRKTRQPLSNQKSSQQKQIHNPSSSRGNSRSSKSMPTRSRLIRPRAPSRHKDLSTPPQSTSRPPPPSSKAVQKARSRRGIEPPGQVLGETQTEIRSMIRSVVARGVSSPPRPSSGAGGGEGGYIDLREDVELKMKPFLVRDSGDGGAEVGDVTIEASSTSPSFDVVDWDREEDLLARQAEATKAQMLKLQRKRDELRYAKRLEQGKKKYADDLKRVKEEAERQLQSRIHTLRAECTSRTSSITSFKSTLKSRIDALCRCYEEVSVREVDLRRSFKEAETRLVEEAKREVDGEKVRMEGELRKAMVEDAKVLGIQGT